MMDIQLAGRTALVTGSTGGIGYAAAEGLARAGAEVVVNGRGKERVAGAVAKLGVAIPGARVRGIAADVGTAGGCDALIGELPEVDILVNNAGIFDAVAVFDLPDEAWQEIFEVNVMSGIRLTRHYAPGMAARGWGRVVFVSSEAAIQIPTAMVHYGMSKTAQLAVSRGMAQEMAGTGVTVNSVLPGPTRTPGVEQHLAAHNDETVPFEVAERHFFAEVRPTSLLRRFILPSEVANLIVYLASENSAATTGGALRVDGGVLNTMFP